MSGYSLSVLNSVPAALMEGLQPSPHRVVGDVSRPLEPEEGARILEAIDLLNELCSGAGNDLMMGPNPPHFAETGTTVRGTHDHDTIAVDTSQSIVQIGVTLLHERAHQSRAAAACKDGDPTTVPGIEEPTPGMKADMESAHAEMTIDDVQKLCSVSKAAAEDNDPETKPLDCSEINDEVDKAKEHVSDANELNAAAGQDSMNSEELDMLDTEMEQVELCKCKP